MGTKRTKSDPELAPWFPPRISERFRKWLPAPTPGVVYLIGVLHTYQKTSQRKNWVVKIGSANEEDAGSVEGAISKKLAPGRGLCNKSGGWKGHGTFGVWVEVPDVNEGEHRLETVLSQLRDNSYPALKVFDVWNDKYARDHNHPEHYLHLRRCKKILKSIAIGMHYENSVLQDAENGVAAVPPYDPAIGVCQLKV
jgi:hypothetical protein